MLRFVVATLLLITSVMTTAVYADEQFAQRSDVQEYIHYMVKQHGFDQKQLTSLFSEVKLRPQVIRHVNKPLEQSPWHTYQMIFVNEWRIEHGVKFWKKYADALKRAEETYGVPASIIVATIGIETRYGQRTGDYRVMDSLANLAFSTSSRAPYFRRELTEFLLLTRDEKEDPFKVMGSYAGAIGQPQFMPSSYRYYAVNFSKSGKIDLMNNEVDVIGSIANYYKKHGWTNNKPVAVPALLVGERYNYLLRNNQIKKQMTVEDLGRYGVIAKHKLPEDHNDMQARLITLQGSFAKEYWLGFHNFYVIKRYNASDLYAMAVFQLGNYITALKERLHDS